MKQSKWDKLDIYKKFRGENFSYVKKGKWYAIFPLVIILAGILVVSIWNFNLGLDFTGGTVIEVSGFTSATQRDDSRAEVKTLMKTKSVTYDLKNKNSEGKIGFSLMFQDIKGTDAEKKAFSDGLYDELVTLMPLADVQTADTISASASSEKIMNTVTAVSIALIAILVYMLFRFKLSSGIAAIIALFHDVLMMLALTVIFRIQINAPFIAAVITVVGYSLNNTLVMFDRVREREKQNELNLKIEQVVDKSVKETFNRQMNTTITTIVPVLVLAIIGVPLIREFAAPILFGLISGAFSSLFVAPSLYVRFENAKSAVRKNKEKKQANLPKTASERKKLNT